ncbi:1,4-dihydroxy-2-naphthoate octaprenyltransferase [Halanaeroarchaeum sp. HSR-CO]|uniref:1,4-dihydroxy-2-naphthoate polyprenyltransferase n=1 Tax=Halanaeroarchaeum sp. HSR-CO TaxID=2866382 RepID=UPI00217D33BC|nr:1,4-dihydroxy-2-naphthoate polyprenyltransferase [Halanaeroarchaeum sp. HSR-CO]UWG47930.1 1,4-dihydroxy-2-naphthoate octaprenyltransferase [Halanaeroarchaeum sp. HSR-CO]
MTDVQHRTKAWLMAARPQTLPAAASPVIVGTAMAYSAEVFALLPALAALVGAELLQIATNFANDYFDAVKGADTDDRQGFTRVTQSGLIPPEQVKVATAATFGLAFLVGIYLVVVGGLPIVVIGLASILAGITYTGGPYPFGYHGLGDLFVFVFFGLIAVTGTYYVQAASFVAGAFPLWMPPGTITVDVLVASLPMAALSTAILVVNNVRDLETDRATGKITLAVRLGYRGSRLEFLWLLALAYLVPGFFVLAGYGVTSLLPLLSLPFAARVWRTVSTETSGEALNPALEDTGKLLAIYAVLFAIGVVI